METLADPASLRNLYGISTESLRNLYGISTDLYGISTNDTCVVLTNC